MRRTQARPGRKSEATGKPKTRWCDICRAWVPLLSLREHIEHVVGQKEKPQTTTQNEPLTNESVAQ